MLHIVLGRGFIGGAIADTLQVSGETVRVFSSADCDLREGASVDHIGEQIGGAAVHGLVVCASRVRLRDNSFRSYCDNVSMAVHAARLVTELRPANVLFFSTVDVYGDQPLLPITPAHQVQPFDHYGRSKLVSEIILAAACQCEGIPLTILRLAGVFGPDDRGNSAMSKMIQRCLEIRAIRVSNAGRTLRDYIFVDDLVQVVQRVLRGDASGTFNGVTGASLTVLDIVQTIIRALGVSCRIHIDEEKGPRDYDLVFDQSSFEQAFGHVRFTALADALLAYQGARAL